MAIIKKTASNVGYNMKKKMEKCSWKVIGDFI